MLFFAPVLLTQPFVAQTQCGSRKSIGCRWSHWWRGSFIMVKDTIVPRVALSLVKESAIAMS